MKQQQNNNETTTEQQRQRRWRRNDEWNGPLRRQPACARMGPASAGHRLRPLNDTTSSADLVSPRSFDERTFYGGGLNAIRDHHRLRSDYNSPSATGDSFSTVALTFYKLSFNYTLQSEKRTRSLDYLPRSWHLQLTNFPSDYR